MENPTCQDEICAPAERSRRKREAPSRLNERAQQKLSWFAKQVEPPEEELGPEEESSPLRDPPKKRKSAQQEILNMVGRKYYHIMKLVPTEEKHTSLFRLGEFNLTGTGLVPGRIAKGSILGFTEAKAMNLFWEMRTAAGNTESCKVTADVPGDIMLALAHRGRRGRSLILRMRECTKFTLSVEVLLSESELPVLADRFEPSGARRPEMKKLMTFFYGVAHKETTVTFEESEEYEVLFKKVLDNQRKEGILPITTPVDCPLKVTLREYQREAVAWMCRMETEPHSIEYEEMWQTVVDKNGRTIHYNHFLGSFAKEIPSAHNIGEYPPGGILADEMGLGKTLEVIALVLSRPRPGFPLTDEETGIVVTKDKMKECRYRCGSCNASTVASCPAYVSIKCPQCWATSDTLLPIKSTLIVCPASICEQWTDEIDWLVGECSLRVFVYQGVRQHGYVPPDRLNHFDLIITTYEVLKKEIYHANVSSISEDDTRKLRTPKRHKALPSPLVSAEFWRVALDEAQMVESSTVKAAQMVLQIPAVNRWCVTGTPIHKDLNDLFGLFVFLRTAPYDELLWFRELILQPYYSGDMSSLVKIMTKCFRRMSKKEVWDQLNIPPQHTHMNELQFSPAEEVFYKSQTVICHENACKVASRFPELSVISKMQRSDMIKLMEPLKRLRQACSHPKAVRDSEIALKNASYTMEDLLAALIKRSVREAEEAQRRVISSLNGLAGLALLRRETLVAADYYRQVLWSISYYSGNLRADPLQQFHTYVNLAALIEENDQQMRAAGNLAPSRWNPHDPAGQSGYGARDVTSEWMAESQFNPPVPMIPRATGDDKLMEHAYQVRDKYLSKYAERQRQAMLMVTNYRSDLQRLSDQFRLTNDEKWYLSFIDEVQASGDGERLVRKLKEHLVLNKGAFGVCLVNKFADCNGLKYLVQNQLDALYESRGHLMKAIDQFTTEPTKENIQSAISCHLRPVKKKRTRCRYCMVQDILLAYESKLFSCDPSSPKPEDSDIDDVAEDEDVDVQDFTRGDGVAKRGTWQLSDVEKIVIYFASLTKTQTRNEDIQFDGNLHCEYMALLRKEFKSFSTCFRETKDYVAALDELEMATLKFELAPDDKVYKLSEKPANVLHLWEIDAQAARLHNDKKLGEDDLTKCLHQLVYLRTLEKANSLTEGSTEECPTCRSALGERWRVFHCGHNICIECLQMLIKTHCSVARTQAPVRVQCPMCRVYSKLEDIFHVDTRKKENEPSTVKVTGSWSTKVTGVIETLIRARNRDPLMKCVVFSLWPSVLHILQKAFVDNNISNVLVASGNQLQRKLKFFKKNPEISVLLMPIKLGSKGLNLTEASHMILIEPLIDSGDELQALGRIHRIGQNKETHVHRFIVKNTIEEKLIQFTKGSTDQGAESAEKAKEEESLTVAKMLALLTQEKDRYTDHGLSSL